MSAEYGSRDVQANPSKNPLARHDRSGRKPARTTIAPTSEKPRELHFANSVWELQYGPAGTIAKVFRTSGIRYEGPISDDQLEVLVEGAEVVVYG